MLLDQPGDAAPADPLASAAPYLQHVDPRGDVRQGNARGH